MRHAAYLRAKEWHKTDPRQIAMAERLREQRKEAYQRAKERTKAYRARIKKEAGEKVEKKRAAERENLRSLLAPARSIKPAIH